MSDNRIGLRVSRVQATSVFPASVEVTEGLTLTKTRNRYVFGLDQDVIQDLAVDPATLAALVADAVASQGNIAISNVNGLQAALDSKLDDSQAGSFGLTLLATVSQAAMIAQMPDFSAIARGLAPASGGGTANFLRADGTWAVPPGTGGQAGQTNLGLGAITATTIPLTSSTGTGVSLPVATPSLAGLESAADKTKLDGVAVGATANSPDATLLARANHTGTQSPATIAFAVAARFMGRITAGAGAGEELTGTQATSLLDIFTASAKGVAPASGGGTTNYLRADGTWATPPGGAGTNLGLGTITGTAIPLTSSTGTGTTLPVATPSLAGLESAADKTKLDGIAAGATANATDAQLRDRSTHTGVQALGTISSVAAARLVGRGSAAGAGALQEITLGSGLTLSGTTLSSTGGTGTPVAVYNGATELTAGATRLTFTGAGATVSEPTPDQITINIPGAAGGTLTMKVKTPYDFGALGGGADDTVALQNFFNQVFDEANRRDFYYDWTGEWVVTQEMYINYDYPNIIDYPLRMRGGTLIVGPIANLPGGVPLENVLTIVGPRQIWDGEITIRNTSGYTSFPLRGFNNGVLIMRASHSWLPVIRVDGARRDSVIANSERNLLPSMDLRMGTPYQMTGTDRNNIGLQIEGIYSRQCGIRSYLTSLHKTMVSRQQGSYNGGVFTAGAGAGSSLQRTRITVDNTTDIRVDDFAMTRLEILPATYGSIAADKTANTLTWSAGDPMAAGLVVGDKILLEDANNVGINDADVFTIFGFSGTNNRTIHVRGTDPNTYPVTETARVYSKLATEWDIHLIREIPNATTVQVFPWIPDRANSKLVPTAGWVLRNWGADGANTRIGFLGALNCAGVCWSYGLYGIQIDTLQSDHADFGYVTGKPNDACYGNNVDHYHLEAAIVAWMQMNATGATDLSGESALDLSRILYLGARDTTAATTIADTAIRQSTLISQGRMLQSSSRGGYEGTSNFTEANGNALTNMPNSKNGNFVGPGGTVEVTCDLDALRLFGYADATLFWIGYGGANPTGTLTFQLGPHLTRHGWVISGNTVTTNPGRLCFFNIRFLGSTKRVVVQEVSQASATGGAATNLGLGTITATAVPLTSSTGSGVSLPVATPSLAGLESAADKTKLDGIANGATANSPDATLLARANHTGTQAPATVAFAATARFLGRITAAAGAGEELTPAQATSLLDVFTSTLKGLAPASGGGTTNFLRADGVWAAPPSSGGTNATNLTLANHGASTLDVLSDTGSDVTLPAATTSLAGLQSAADKTKLNGIATGATANSSDATLLARANHTGTQAPATIAFAATDRLLGRATAGAGAGEEIVCTAFGRSLIDDADAAAGRATLDAEQLGVLAGLNVQTASYTLVMADRGKAVEMNVAAANNLTVPPNSAVAFPVGTRIDLTQMGAGQTTVVAGAGVTIRQRESKLKVAGQYGGASLYKRATDEWVLFGDLAA